MVEEWEHYSSGGSEGKMVRTVSSTAPCMAKGCVYVHVTVVPAATWYSMMVKYSGRSTLDLILVGIKGKSFKRMTDSQLGTSLHE